MNSDPEAARRRMALRSNAELIAAMQKRIASAALSMSILGLEVEEATTALVKFSVLMQED